MIKGLIYYSILCLGLTGICLAQSFISVSNGKLIKEGKPYYFAGVNMWYALYLGAELNPGDQERLINELDSLQKRGINNLRIMAATEGGLEEPMRVQPSIHPEPGIYNETLLEGMDFLLNELGKRNMVAVLCLNNFFHWSGGMAQYVSWADGTDIPYPHLEGSDWTKFQNYSSTYFANKKAQRIHKKFVRKLIKRKNTFNGIRYKDDPSIMAWQLANEPRGFAYEEEYLIWVEDLSRFIHKKDKNHLVSLGGEGSLTGKQGTAFSQVARIPSIDYLTAHLWVENWGWYNPKKPELSYESSLKKAAIYLKKQISTADSVNKPLVLEEFGMSRDNGNHHPHANTSYRDQYYDFLLKILENSIRDGHCMSGVNVWSWSGQGLPPRPEEFWQQNDPLTGDPPHEKQGWYSIYNSDMSTLEMIQKYNQRLAHMSADRAKK
ncbi:MAG: cellulase family glycosylhydrolase [Bacteroidia bacterium]|nr:cellulase family glycosylhydrolase [Bacteroidia bacterium]